MEEKDSEVPNVRVLSERFAGLVAVIAVLPTLLLFALMLCTNSDEPVLLKDRFVVKKGRPVQAYRFRMTGRGTPAFRWFGRHLRTFSLDELPGFWSVALGECGLLDIGREVRKW